MNENSKREKVKEMYDVADAIMHNLVALLKEEEIDSVYEDAIRLVMEQSQKLDTLASNALWFETVAYDLNIINTYKDLNDADIRHAAERLVYVYDGVYNCDLDYWTQLEHVLAEVEREKKKIKSNED